MPHLTELPPELLLLDVFWRVSLPDVLSLACCSKAFAGICSDDFFWHQKILEDFDAISPTLFSMRRCSLKTLYLRIRRPQIYVWGSVLREFVGPHHAPAIEQCLYKSAVPIPIPLYKPPNARIVQLVAGGSSFAALDDQGRLYFWGALSLENGVVQAWDQWEGDRRTDSGAAVVFPHPVLLQLPMRMVHMSAGLSHVVALDSSRHIWVFTSCLRPYKIVSPSLDCSTPSSTPAQVVAGRTFISVLTDSGDVYVTWPFRGRAVLHTLEHNLQHHYTRRLDNLGHDDILVCEPWENEFEPLQLPSLPSLPCPPGVDQEEFDTSLKLVSIAAGHNFLVGLTSFGHVLKINLQLGDQDGSGWAHYDDWGLSELGQAFEDGRVLWVYLRDFNERKALPYDGHISHKIAQISAYGGSFCAFSESADDAVPQVFLTEDTVAQSYNFIRPALQGRKIASAHLGHSHHSVITDEGELLIWGGYTSGALGLGHPRDLKPRDPGGCHNEDVWEKLRKGKWAIRSSPPGAGVDNPSPVRFDWTDGRRFKFVLGVALGDEHSGAIVIDLEAHTPHLGKTDSEGWTLFVKRKISQLCGDNSAIQS